MIIAITSNGDKLDSKVSEKFGRCRYFILVDPDTMKLEAVKNPAEQIQVGAGPKAAETIIKKGVNVLLTGHVGDKAEDTLKRGNVKIYDQLTEGLTVKDSLKKYLNQY